MSTWVEPWTDAEGAATVRAAFVIAYGYEPAGVWAAPGRVNIIGEHVDYNGGVCLPTALPHRTYLAYAPRADTTVRLRSRAAADWDGDLRRVGPGQAHSWTDYVVGVAWALAQAGANPRGFDAVVESRVPFGAGLSSSAALESAAALAIADTPGWDGPTADTTAGRRELIAASIRAENEIAGANTGGMDQHASMLCEAGHALHFDTRSGEIFQAPFDLAGNGMTLLVIDTKAPHALVDGQYAQRRATCEAAATALGVSTLREVTDLDAALGVLENEVARKRVRHIVTEIVRVEAFVDAFATGDLERAGRLMIGSHESLRRDYEVSAPELDLAVEVAMGGGAIGARMTGGGFGGSAIAIVPTALASGLAEQVAAAFTGAGFAGPEFLLAPPSAAAERVD